MLDRAAIDAALQNLSAEEKWRMLEIIQEIEQREFVNLCRGNLHQFVLAMQPDYKMGAHLKRLYGLLSDVEKGEKDRILVNMPPRFGKSVAISIMFPAWYLGKHPDHKLIIASHTADLAVDMLRKVRNIMQTEEYKRIFPGVDIAADAKAAGKWNTTKGGEAYAVGVGGALAGRGANLCLHLETKVRVKGRGLINAGLVQVGDFIWTHAGYVPVLARIDSTHEATVAVNGALRVTKEHPIWVFGRGWVEAGEVNLGDVLWTTCLYDKVKALLQGAIHAKNNPRQILYSDLQHMGCDAPALYQSKRSKLRKLWGQGYKCLRAMGDIFKLPSRYGRSPLSAAHTGSHRQCEGLFTGKLPVGRYRDAAEQQAIMRLLRARGPKVDRTTVGPQSGNYDRYVQTSSKRAWYEYCASLGSTKDVSCPEEGYPEVFGWFRNCCARFLSRSGQKHKPTRLRKNKKGALGSFRSGAGDLLGFLLGVRRVDHLALEEHKPRSFVNFMVGGDNTFVADSILTHNCIVDDPFSEQDVINGNYEVFDKVYEWYTYGLRTRLMPGGALAVLHTRWSLKDITSRLLKDGQLNPESDQYELFEFPAILNEGEEDQKSLWPEQWSLEALLRTKASMPSFQWAAQYQQNPTNEAGGIVKKEWFQIWEKDTPPKVEFIIMALDAAVEAKQRSDFNALTTWGVFNNEETRRYEVILLNSLNFRAEFPELKDKATQEYMYWEPDAFIIEAKANGAPLLQEFRRAGIVLQAFVPHRGTGDKTMRLNAIADMIRDGLVWVPQTRWAEELVDQIVTFPAADKDDLCFVSNTKISLADGGNVCIVDLKPGDLVATPSGPCEVDYCVESNNSAQVIRVAFSDGTELIGTPNHPIYHTGLKAFVPLGALSTGDTVWTQSNELKSLSIEELGIVDTLIHPVRPYADIFTGSATERTNPSIGVYGKTPTGLFLKAWIFITKTDAWKTIHQKILSALVNKRTMQNISETTTPCLCINESGPQRKEQKTRGLKKSLLNLLARGVDAFLNPCRLIGLSIVAKSVETYGIPEGPKQFSAWSATKSLKQASPKQHAPMSVKKSVIGGEKSNAISVGTYHEHKLRPALVPLAEGEVYVTSVHSVCGAHAVYALRVKSNPVFYANGVLVHNCDSTVMALMRMRQGGFVTLSTDEDYDDNVADRPRRAYY